MFVVLLLLVSVAVPFGCAQEEETTLGPDVPVTERAETVCPPCPKVTSQHYTAKLCTPVYGEENTCCPQSYECPDTSVYLNTLTTCQYKNVTYQINDTVPVDGPCRSKCICEQSIDPTEPADIVCDQRACPVSHGLFKPGCRRLYDSKSCCAVATECNEVLSSPDAVADPTIELRTPDCSANGFNYFKGDVIPYPEAPCQYCVCTEGFEGAYGPGCETVDCGLDFQHQKLLGQGCVPLYSSTDCCPTEWVCAGNTYLIPSPPAAPVAEGDAPVAQCVLGDVRVPVGRAANATTCRINCVCNTPPDLTCVSYPSCEAAIHAFNFGILL